MLVVGLPPDSHWAMAAQMEASSPLGADAPESEGAEEPDEPEDGAGAAGVGGP